MDRRTIWACAPYVAWMALMSALPSTASAYAVRVAAALVLLCGWLIFGRRPKGAREAGDVSRPSVFGWCAALGVGVAVCVLWVWPERLAAYRAFCTTEGIAALFSGAAVQSSAMPSPYDPSVCGWGLTIIRLLGSALVIAPVEELFFRSFLYRRLQKTDWTSVPHDIFDLSAFLWMIGLFALEHDRWLAGAMAGAAYGALYLRLGLVPAVIAHAVTNLLLGLWVIREGAWAFW